MPGRINPGGPPVVTVPAVSTPVADVVLPVQAKPTGTGLPDNLPPVIHHGNTQAAVPDFPTPNVPAAPTLPGDVFNSKPDPRTSPVLTGRGQETTDVGSLVGSLKDLDEPQKVPTRFLKDLAVVRHELLENRALNREEKATRLFQFFAPYGEKFAQLQQQHPQTQARSLLTFNAVLQKQGFGELRDTRTGQTGLEAAKSLLTARNPSEARQTAEVRRFDAPSWPELTLGKESVQGGFNERPQNLPQNQQSPMVMGRPELNVPGAVQRRDDPNTPEEENDPGRRRSKVLGSQMLWNVMHRFRNGSDPDAESMEQRDTMNRLMVAVGLVFFGLAAVAALLINL